MNKELVVYGRRQPCPDQMRTQRFLQTHRIPYRQINIDEDEAALEFVMRWVGHRSVPTLIVAHSDDLQPIADPAPVPAGRSTRSLDRGTMITEPSDEALQRFLHRHDLTQ